MRNVQPLGRQAAKDVPPASEMGESAGHDSAPTPPPGQKEFAGHGLASIPDRPKYPGIALQS